MSNLKERLVEAESRFFEALSDPLGIESFRKSWSNLTCDVERAILCNAVDANTMAQYHSTSMLVEELSLSMEEFYRDVEAIDAAFQQDLEKIFVNSEKSGTLSTLHRDVSSTRRDISLAANWLSRNYHNPYPSKDVRDEISRKSSWNRKDVDAWFTEARKRIGWNDIRKTYFGNRRAETVQTATEFFGCSHTSLDPALAQAFIDMESQVHDLYLEPFKPSKLAIVLGEACKDKISPDTRKVKSSRTPTPSRMATSYLPPLSPVSRSVSPVRTARKRTRSDLTNEDEPTTKRLKKKARQEGPTEVGFTQTQLPSPAASQSDLIEQTPEAVISELSRVGRSPSFTPLRLPKRRHSHSETQGCTKYPSLGSRAAGLQTVSTPLPSAVQSQCSASPRAPATSDNSSTDASYSPISHIPPAPAVLPDTQATLVQRLLSQAKVPQSSFDYPDPVTCDHPASIQGLQSVDLALANSSGSQSCMTIYGEGNHVPDLSISALLGNTSHTVSSTSNVDLPSLPDLFNDVPLYNGSSDQIFGLLRSPFDQNTMTMPALQVDGIGSLAEVDISFATPYLDFDSGASSQIPQPQIDDMFLGDFIHDLSVPSAEDAKKAKYVAHLTMLKREKNHLQERIQLLERQILST